MVVGIGVSAYLISNPDTAGPRIAKAVGIADNLGPLQRKAIGHYAKFANDPKSVEVVEWRPVVECDRNLHGDRCDSAVYAVVRPRDGFGALTVSEVLFYFLDGEVIRVDDSLSHGLPSPFAYQVNLVYDLPIPENPVVKNLEDMRELPPKAPDRPLPP